MLSANRGGMRVEVVMGNATGKWLVLSLIACGCGAGSQASAPGANSADEAQTDEHSSVAGPQNAVTKRGSGSVAALLGRGGGTLELSEGPQVRIPAGAVESGQEFVLKVAPKTTAFFNKESERPLGPTFSFSPGLNAPDGSSIEVSFPLATLPAGWGEPSIAYEEEEGSEISYGEDSTRTKWQYERASLSGGRVVGRLSGLQGLRMQFVLTNLEAQ
jgi:hypothetical protein